jgi:hypothetical protein
MESQFKYEVYISKEQTILQNEYLVPTWSVHSLYSSENCYGDLSFMPWSAYTERHI